jgi:hypothetical protein
VEQPAELLETGTAIIEAITTDRACLEVLDREGFRLVDVANLFKLFADTNAIRSAFRGLGPFLLQLLDGSDWTVKKGSPGQQARIVRLERPLADRRPLTGSKITLRASERASIEEAAKDKPLKLPKVLGSVLTDLFARVEGQDIEISQLMLAAGDTGLREATQTFFGTITALVRMSLAGTDLCVVQSTKQPARHWVNSRIEFHGDVDSVQPLDDLPPPSAADMARRVLRRSLLPLPADRDDIDDILRAVTKMPLEEDESLNEFIARLVESETLPAAVQLAPLKQMLAVLVQVGVFVGPSNEAPDWLDQLARQPIEERAEVRQRVRQAVMATLAPYGLDDDEVLNDLLPLGGRSISEVTQ